VQRRVLSAQRDALGVRRLDVAPRVVRGRLSGRRSRARLVERERLARRLRVGLLGAGGGRVARALGALLARGRLGDRLARLARAGRVLARLGEREADDGYSQLLREPIFM